MFRARTASLITLAFMVVVLGAIYWTRTGALHGITLPPTPAPAFELEAPYRGPVSLTDFRDHVVLLTFGRPSCDARCNPQLGTLRDVLGRLGPRRRDVRVLYVTLEPERMNEQQLLAFLQEYDLGFTGLRGDTARVRALADRLRTAVRNAVDSTGAAVSADAPRPAVPQSPRVYGIDRRGVLRVAWGPDDPEVLVHDIRTLLRY